MKLRKILTGAVATVACVAMLSTNVLAAVTITPGADGNKLTVGISGTTGQTTFLALDQDTVPENATGDDIQYIDQDDAATLNIAFAKRESSDSNIVDLYVGGESVESYSLEEDIYVTAVATASAVSAIEYPSEAGDDFASIDDAALKTLLNGKVKVAYNAIGSKVGAATEVTYDGSNADFVFGTISTNDYTTYTVPVTYKSIAAGNISVTEVDPATITDITIIGLPATAPTVYVDSAADFDETAARAELAKISGLSAQTTLQPETGDSYNGTIGFDKLGVSVSGGVVSFTYEGITIEETVRFNVVEKAIEKGVVVGGTTATLTTRDADAVVEADAIQAVKDAGIKVTYTWNDGATSEASDLTYAAADKGNGTWEVTITGAVALENNVITVTVVENAATLIKGTVKATDATGQVGDFENGIPVGAVVTVIPYNEDAMGNVTGTEEAFTAKSVVVGADGSFEVEVEPESGDYQVIISHVKFSIYGGEVFSARSILDANTNQVVNVAAEDVDMGTVTLRYTFFGDINVDGTLNPVDFGLFTQGFGTSVPGLN